MNHIGRCVVAGNVRQSAEIAFGEPTEEYLNLKNYGIHESRMIVLTLQLKIPIELNTVGRQIILFLQQLGWITHR